MKLNKIADKWMLHADLIPHIVTGPPIDDDFILFRCQNENYIDVKHVLTIALSPRRCRKALQYPFYGEDVSYSRYRILAAKRDSRIHFLSRGLRQGLRKVPNHYVDDEREIIADRYSSNVGGTLTYETRIKLSFLRRQLRDRRLGAIWCLESYRFSEREPRELGIEASINGQSGEDYVYQVTIDSHDGLPFRMKTLARLTGKRILF